MSKGTVIIGNGVAGITTARHLRKHSDQRIQVISSETPYFFSRTALMYVYMGHMKFEHIQPYENDFWVKNRIELVQCRVQKIDFNRKLLYTDTGEEIGYDQLVLATGSKSRYFNWPGQNLKGVQGLFSYQDLQELESNTPTPFQKDHPCKKAVIVGAGLIGVELAEMLVTRGVEVTILVRDSYFWGNVITANEGLMINAHIQHHGVELLFNTELESIEDDGNGRVKGVRLGDGSFLDCQLVGIATGVEPNIDFLRNTELEIDRGILVDDTLKTNIDEVYAVGDCAELRQPSEGRRSIEPVWYVGRMMGEVLGKTLSGEETAYRPGPWFNSAKFFDIEYQTYGLVKPVEDSGQKHFFWKHPSKNRCVTVAYNPVTEEFRGINVFGIRVRHSYFDHALRKALKVGEVIGGLKSANFDPEFYVDWTRKLIPAFERETGIKAEKKNAFQKLFSR
jgi:NAD(P)H-nitrite reductase large subunit